MRKGWVPRSTVGAHISGVMLAKDSEAQDPPCVCSSKGELQKNSRGWETRFTLRKVKMIKEFHICNSGETP